MQLNNMVTFCFFNVVMADSREILLNITFDYCTINMKYNAFGQKKFKSVSSGIRTLVTTATTWDPNH